MDITFKDFLVKYSNIEKTFVQDFNALFDNIYNENEFKIDLDILVKWLGI